MNTTTGDKLNAEDKNYVLENFDNRYTKDHIPEWVTAGTSVQFASDEDWLRHTEFEVTESGDFDRSAIFCNSHPTWPDNPELKVQTGNLLLVNKEKK